MVANVRFAVFCRHAPRVLFALVLALLVAAGAAAEQAVDKALEEQILKVIREHPKEIMEAVVGYQRAQAEQRMKSAETRLQEQVASLQADELLGTSPLRGKLGSKLVLIEFSDFQCPYCAKAHQVVQQFMTAHGGEVALVYKHLPLDEMHPQATNAALASWAAQQQGKFWEFHDQMFSAPDRLGDAFYVAIATSLALDVARFDKDRASDAAKAAVQRDLDLAKKLNIQATPQFLMNSHPITGAAPLEEFEKELATARGELK